ncbi:methyl-CpG-binding domain-containing protein [Salix suchowensis]|nr:methyl-CpG-binding domain-containing protein [Salix suchowensis]
MDPTKILQIQPGFSNDVEMNVAEMQTIVSDKMKFTSLRAHASTPNQELVDQFHSKILSEVSKIIKDQIKASKKIISEMNGINSSDLTSWHLTTSQKKRVTKSVLTGLLPISFEIPEEYLMLEMDKLLLPDLDGHEAPDRNKKLTLFPFSERTNAWILERRRRADERHDLYYHHEKSNVTFRSTTEVVNFILYNAYPGKKQVTEKSALQENPLIAVSCSGTRIWNEKENMFHRNQASSSSSAPKQLNKNQTEEELVGLKGDSSENLPNSDEQGKPDNLDNSDSEATESDEDIYRAHQPFQHPLSLRTKSAGNNGNCSSTDQALVNSGDGKQNETVIENVSSEEVGDLAIQAPVELAVMEKKDSVTSASNPMESNTEKKEVEDIFGQLGDLEDTSIAVQVLSNQFNLGDDIDKDLCFY